MLQIGLTQRVIEKAEVIMANENITKELNKAKAHIERAGEEAGERLQELSRKWLAEGVALSKRALDLGAESLRRAANSLDEAKSKLSN